MVKDHSRNTRARWEICSKITIKAPEGRHWPCSDVFIVNFRYFTRYCTVPTVDFDQVNVCEEPVLWISIYPREEWRYGWTVFIFNFDYFSHLVLVLLLLILSVYLFPEFDILYFSRFYIKMNSNVIVYSFLERISTNWNVHHLASSPKQDIFNTNFNADITVNFLYLFLFHK